MLSWRRWPLWPMLGGEDRMQLVPAVRLLEVEIPGEKSFLSPWPEPATATPAGAVGFLGRVAEGSSPHPVVLAPEGNLTSSGSDDEGDAASFSSLGASSRSRL